MTYSFFPSVATCSADDTIPTNLQTQLHSLHSGKKRPSNLKPNSGADDQIQEGEEEGYESDADEPLDIDGAGADVPLDREPEREDAKEKDAEVKNDGDDQRPPKRMRMTADAGIALIGLETGIVDFGRISRSTSRCSSVSSVRSAMSLS